MPPSATSDKGTPCVRSGPDSDDECSLIALLLQDGTDRNARRPGLVRSETGAFKSYLGSIERRPPACILKIAAKARSALERAAVDESGRLALFGLLVEARLHTGRRTVLGERL